MNKHEDQEGYYSSDDDVAWGPYTLREAKRDLRRTPVKINYRHTDLGLAKKCQVHSKPEPASDSSAYYTPDESLAPQRNEAFLEKMEKLINDGEQSRYASALDASLHAMHIAEAQSGLSPILNTTNCYSINRLDSIQQTLVDDTKVGIDTITISDEDSHSVLDISDTSDCSLGPDPGIIIKVEPPTEINIADTFIREEQSSTSSSKQSVEASIDEVLSRGDEKLMTSSNDTYSEEDEVDHALPQKRFNISNGSSDEFSNEAVKHVLEKRLQSCRESDMMMLGLNDTIEEMEMMLKYGPNYLMPDEVGAKENGYKTPQYSDVHSRVHNKHLLTGKFDHVKSPIAEYIKKNTPIQPPKFKLPEATTRPPTLKFPQNHQFKDIISPIKIYINTPVVCLKRNVVGQEVSQLDLPDTSVTSQEDADATVSTDFPEVIYVPSKHVVTTTVKQQALPEYIRKLVGTTTIEKHDKKTAKLKKEVISEKLLSEDLTNLSFSDPDLYENSEDLVDISYVTRKYVFPK